MAKKLISIRLDGRILDWFKAHSKGPYQTLINTVLEDYVEAQKSSADRRAGRAQEFFRQFYAQCFWHYDPNLRIDSTNIQIVAEGLRKYGGREGLKLSEELCQ